MPHLKGIFFEAGHHVFTDLFQKKERRKKYDVTLIGSNEGRRVQLLDYLKQELKSHDISLYKVGGLVDSTKGDPAEGLTDQFISWNSYVEIINFSKICLSSQTQSNRNQIKGKVLEYLACGTFCLSDSNPDLRRLIPDDCIVYYDSFEDCLNKIVYYVQHDDEREKIANAGYQWFHQTYNYRKFWSEFLLSIRQGDTETINRIGQPPLSQKSLNFYQQHCSFSTLSFDDSESCKGDRVTPAAALWNQRFSVLEAGDQLRSLFEAVGHSTMLMLNQWFQWYALALDLKPDLILELGRNWGNSTCVFTEAANQLGNCRVVSLCPSTSWAEITQPHLAQIVSELWFRVLDPKVTDIPAADVETIIGDSQCVLLLWNVSGSDNTEFVLGRILPLLRNRRHVVIVPNISDTRYTGVSVSYGEQGLWRNQDGRSNQLILDHLSFTDEKVISILEFAARNRFMFHSADHSFLTDITGNQMIDLINLSVDRLFWQNSHWFWFSLNEIDIYESIYFPTVDSLKPGSNAKSAEIVAPEMTMLEQRLQQAEARIVELESHIAAMQSSKFWKLRTLWLRLKRTIR
ncbi:glycosyltransferase [Kovacikia minuta CCNUW1]|nr:glycosyltransferase [Kovacikia minuta CCNUW1]